MEREDHLFGHTKPPFPEDKLIANVSWYETSLEFCSFRENRVEPFTSKHIHKNEKPRKCHFPLPPRSAPQNHRRNSRRTSTHGRNFFSK